MTKKFYTCKVCGDIHYGVEAPDICPTCKAQKAYASINEADAKKAMGFK